MRLRFVSPLIVLLSLGFLSGCGGDSFNRVPMKGTVKLNGAPVESGGIVAIPDPDSSSSDSEKLPRAQAAIIDGGFQFEPDQSPAPGEYLFEISVAVPDENADPSASPEGEEEVGANTVLYKKKVTVPQEGEEAFLIELTDQDKAPME